MSNLPEFTQLSLLLKVIPGFHGVCDFYMSDHNAAVEVQQRLGKGNRFFENLSLRLSSLYQTFTALSPDNETWSARSVRSALNDLLDAFRHCLTLNANICFKTKCNAQFRALDSKGSGLVAFYHLLQCIGKPVNQVVKQLCSIDQSFRRSFDFIRIAVHKDRRAQLFKAVLACKNAVSSELASSDGDDFRVPLTHAAKIKAELVVQDDARGLSARTFPELARRFACDCRPPAQGVRVLLDRHSHTPSSQWKLQCVLQRRFTCGWQWCDSVQRQRSVEKPAKKMISFKITDHLDPTRSKQKANCSPQTAHSHKTHPSSIAQKRHSTFDRTDALCRLVHGTKKHVDCCMFELILNDPEPPQLFYDPALKASTIPGFDPKRHCWIQLSRIINGEGIPFGIADIYLIERVALAVVLANAFLHLYETEWWPEDWSSSSVYLIVDLKEGRIDLRRPFLATTCKPGVPRKPLGEAPFMQHPYPHILRLGVVLIELCDGIKVESTEEVRKRLGVGGEWAAVTALKAAMKACFNVQQFPASISFDDKEFRRLFWDTIAHQLEEGFTNGFNEGLDFLDRPVSKTEQVLPDHVRAKLQKMTIPPNESFPHLDALWEAQLGSLSASTASAAQYVREHEEQSPEDTTLHADSGQDRRGDPEKIQFAKEWIQKYLKEVHKWTNRPTRVHPMPSVKIKIAVLDTGVDLPLALRSSVRVDVTEARSWLGKRVPINGVPLSDSMSHDPVGHGTHAAGLILSLAPMVEVYSAQVFGTDLQRRSAQQQLSERIAQAIRYATNEWKVNIISMSFGSTASDNSVVEEAIEHARSQRVLMFASASNGAGNSPVSYPARSGHGIPVFAMDGGGNFYLRTPTAERALGYNFATLGVEVESWWPESLCGDSPNPRKRSSGTSIATPIVAASAANVLSFFLQYSDVAALSEAERNTAWDRLRTPEGMKGVLREMTDRNPRVPGYDYLQPWLLWSLGDVRATIMRIKNASAL